MPLKSSSDLKSYSYYESLLGDPRIQATLNTIAQAEGMFTAKDPYSTRVGYGTFDNSGWHPGDVVKGTNSSAAGKYQGMRGTFGEVATAIGIPNIGPVNQDVFVIARMDQRGVLDAALAGDIKSVAKGLSDEFASFPGNSYGQGGGKTQQQFEGWYSSFLDNAMNTPATMNGLHQDPYTIEDSPTMAAQKGLAGLGYVSADDMTGAYGRMNSRGSFNYDLSLVEGIKALQKDYGLPQTGELNDQTLGVIEQQTAAQNARDARLGMLPTNPLQTVGELLDNYATVDGIDYSRLSADLTGSIPSGEAAANLTASLGGLSPQNAAPSYPETPRSFPVNPAIEASRLAGAYRAAQYQPAISNTGWQDQPTVNERMASPRDYTPEQQRLQETIRQSVAPSQNMVRPEAAAYGLPAARSAPSQYQSTGAFNNVAQTQPSGTFTPTSPFGRGLSPASGLPQSYPETPRSYPSAPAPAAPVSAVPANVASAYSNYGATRSMAPANPVPASRSTGIDVNNSAMSLADQYASYGAGKVPVQSASTAPQSLPAPAPVAPRQAAPVYTAPARTVAARTVTPYTPPQPPAMTAERAKALGMVETVPGKYMPNVAANPAQVLADQAKLVAANPIAAIGKTLAGTMLGGVFFERLPQIAQALAPEVRQAIGGGLTAPGGMAAAGGGSPFSGRGTVSATPSSGGSRAQYDNGWSAYSNPQGVTTTFNSNGEAMGGPGGGASGK